MFKSMAFKIKKMLKQVQHDGRWAFNYVVFIIILGLMLTSPACAGDFVDLEIDENYLIITDRVVKTIGVKDPSIVVIKPFFTIFNEKNLMLLNPKKVGKTSFNFATEGEVFEFDIQVNPNKKKFYDFKTMTKSGFDFLLLDKPPENLELDKPPVGE